ncbi:uncharacterized protein LOC122082744 isoform X6 [Macadamia integrifolia]|uniref:uncharacterized protein LOC122082744 isoform X6 n=1 Tax=Macadamia integrifolia TaxID=60698 RepID=UPI001C4FEA5F|nr:uncharacterized protein LOC122082744 isoform X6 [Macadamia integrifolia]
MGRQFGIEEPTLSPLDHSPLSSGWSDKGKPHLVSSFSFALCYTHFFLTLQVNWRPFRNIQFYNPDEFAQAKQLTKCHALFRGIWSHAWNLGERVTPQWSDPTMHSPPCYPPSTMLNPELLPEGEVEIWVEGVWDDSLLDQDRDYETFLEEVTVCTPYEPMGLLWRARHVAPPPTRSQVGVASSSQVESSIVVRGPLRMTISPFSCFLGWSYPSVRRLSIPQLLEGRVDRDATLRLPIPFDCLYAELRRIHQGLSEVLVERVDDQAQRLASSGLRSSSSVAFHEDDAEHALDDDF